jgi:hypothetical protein
MSAGPEKPMTDETSDDVLNLAHALWVWEIAGLELGELAILAGATPAPDHIARVGAWRSGRRVVALSRDQRQRNTEQWVKILDPADQPATLQQLSAAAAEAPGAAAVIWDSSAMLLELVLEVMPAWGRIVLTGDTAEPATVDFYNNVHRKGCRILSAPSTPDQMHEELWQYERSAHVTRAMRLFESRSELVGREA